MFLASKKACTVESACPLNDTTGIDTSKAGVGLKGMHV